jgi:hypothetical protein
MEFLLLELCRLRLDEHGEVGMEKRLKHSL